MPVNNQPVARDSTLTWNISAEPIHVLIVDDEESICRILSRVLEPWGYICAVASHTQEANEQLQRQTFEVVLCDVNMPGESGFEVIRHASATPAHPAVIMVTGQDDPDIVKQAIEQGAYGYIVKPFKPSEVLINVMNAVRRRALEKDHRRHTEELEQRVSERTRELRDAVIQLEAGNEKIREAQEETVDRLATAAEFRDLETAQHVQRMSRYCALLADKLGWHQERCALIRLSGSLHDIGKFGVPEGILLKPGPLSPEEFEVMKRHTEMGHRILGNSSSEMIQMAAVIALSHHEKIDGTGYPRKLLGDAIPMEGRIAAIADVFDALTNRRVYKPAFSVENALTIMQKGRGTHFDSRLLDMFIGSQDEVEAIRLHHQDK